MHDVSALNFAIIQQDKFSIKFCHYTARQVWHKILPLYIQQDKNSYFMPSSARPLHRSVVSQQKGIKHPQPTGWLHLQVLRASYINVFTRDSHSERRDWPHQEIGVNFH